MASEPSLPPSNPESQAQQSQSQTQGQSEQAAGTDTASTATTAEAAIATGTEEQPDPRQTQEGDGQEEGPVSPPLPTRHTALTPGPRASRFQMTLGSALSHTLAKISWDNFAACYPHIATHAPATLRAVQSQMVDRLRSLCQKEFDSIQQSRNVVAKLNELESLVSEAARRRKEAGEDGEAPLPPHMLPPDEVLDAHMAPHLIQQQSQLNAKLQTTQSHNAMLFEDIKRQRAEIESLVSLLEKVLEDVDNTNHMMDDVVDVVARETRTIEIEMAEP
ncbi:Nnf1-domain-containing protein [Xylaria intraflava]|nr:Nnf1-domain-containing protein [Xylaria intraflava]